MTTLAPIHPAIVLLLKLQGWGRLRRMARRFCQPRRIVLSSVACLLAAVWLGNAALTIWLRETAAPETLRAFVALGFVLYGGWHVTKAALFRPSAAFDWRPAERDLLAACPLRTRDLVGYQLASVLVPTLLKGGLLAFLLVPDLRSVPLGLCGILLGLYLLEVLRMAVDIFAWGVSRSVYVVYRVGVVAGLAGLGSAATWWMLREGERMSRINFGEGVLDRFVDVLVQLAASPVGHLAAPFRPVVELVVADSLSAASLVWAMTAVALVVGLGVVVAWSYALLDRIRTRREQCAYEAGGTRPASGCAVSVPIRAAQPRMWRGVPRWGGAGPLAWRQLLGARRHWGSLATAMIAPAVLAATPSFVVEDAYNAFLATVGALAFYTFLLLPTALRFDFRRDLDRLPTLKGLPISPAAAAVGQTLTPVLLTTVFQAVVLAFAVAVLTQPVHFLPATLLILLPMNVFVFGLDNWIFLLYPYRIQQEGVEIFLRTMLTFTGKGLLFVVGLAAMSAWGFAAAVVARNLGTWTGSAVNAYAVFTAGMILGMCMLAAVVLGGASRTYARLDAIEDVPR